jgi:hypothetical protein
MRLRKVWAEMRLYDGWVVNDDRRDAQLEREWSLDRCLLTDQSQGGLRLKE